MALTNLQIGLYAIFKHSGLTKKECVALLALLNRKEQELTIEKIAELMDNNDWILPTEQELMEILWPILKARN